MARALPPLTCAWIALIVSMTSNLTLLGFFKYFNFGVGSYDALITWVGMPSLRLDSVLRVTLPLGISFYTFQSMSYAWDVYRGRATAISNFIDFACYVSMFPQLVAGPIIRFSEVADQLTSDGTTSYSYDENGNLTDAGSDEFEWDYRNMMTSATIDSRSPPAFAGR